MFRFGLPLPLGRVMLAPLGCPSPSFQKRGPGFCCACFVAGPFPCITPVRKGLAMEGVAAAGLPTGGGGGGSLAAAAVQAAAAAASPSAPSIDGTSRVEHRIPLLTLGDKIAAGRAQPDDLEKAFGSRGHSLLSNVCGGVLASTMIAPAMTVLDLALIRSQLQSTPFRHAIVDVARDLWAGMARWSPFLGIMNVVYGSIYITANCTKAVCDDAGVDYRMPTIGVTSAVTISVIAWKEKQFAKRLLTRARKVPMASYGLFAIRDTLTIAASFVLKNQVRDALQDQQGLSHRDADLVASLTVPAAAQLVNAPFHMLALDLCARPGVPASERLASIVRGYAAIANGRALRILPAYGIGGYINSGVKEALKGVEEREHMYE